MADRSVKVDLTLDPSKYIAGARAASAATRDLEKSARDLRRAEDNAATAAGELRVAESRLAEVNANAKSSVSQRAQAEETLSRAQRNHKASQEDLTAATKRFTEAQKRAGDESNRSGKQTEDAMGRMAKRTNAQFDALKFTGLSVGLPAAAAVGAAGVTASLVLIAGGFAALGASFAIHSAEVQGAAKDMANGVLNDLDVMSQPLKKDLVEAVDSAGAAWGRLRPEVQAAVQGSAPAIRELTGAATDFAENAMPGMLVAVEASGPALQGIRTFAGQAGAGLSDFFANASQGADGARQGMVVFGGTVQTLEGRFGSLFANLANGSSGPLQSLDVMVDQLSGGLVDMTASGSGVVGMFQGFSNAGSGAATVIHALLAGVSALPPQMTQLAGSWQAASMIAGKFGVDAGKGFEGLGSKISTAAKTGKGFGDVFAGLVGGAINPAFLAVTALGIGLDLLGQKEQKAAQYAAEHRDSVRQLTEAYRQDAGVLGESIATVNAKALADKNATNNLATFGVTIGTAAEAIRGSTSAYDTLKTSAQGTLATIADSAGITQENKQALVGLADESLRTGENYDQLKDKVKLYGTQMDGANGTVQRFSASQQTAIEQLINGTGAVGEQVRAQKDAHDAYLQSEQALTGLSQAQIEARNATDQHTQAILAQQNAQLGYRGALLTTEEAEKNYYNQVLKNGKASAKDKEKAALDLERAYAAQEQAAYNAAYAESRGRTEDEKKKDATNALNAEVVKLANNFKGPLPQSLQNTLAAMTPIEAAAAGATIAISKTGEAVYRLPNGKEIKIKPTTEEAQRALETWRQGQEGLSITQKVFSNTGPATGQVLDWQNTTRTIEGNTTTYTHTDPATHAVSVWKTVTDATGAVTTTMANVDPATGRVRVWKQQTDGTWAEVTADANANPAYRAIMDVASRNYTATINVGVNYTESIRIPNTNMRMFAQGGIAFDKGAYAQPVVYNDVGRSLSPMSGSNAVMVPPNTWRVVGDNMTVPELYAPLNGSERTADLILQAGKHEGLFGPKMMHLANGGMVQAEDGSWVPESFYGGAPKGPHAMYTDSGFAKLRARATANGIWSLSDMDQNQLRTYGGWTDSAQTPLQRAIRSGNASRSYSGGGRATLVQNFNFPNYVGNRSELIAEIRKSVSNEGGNVQQVLGRRR